MRLRILAICFLFCGTAGAQIYTPVTPTTFGRNENRIRALKTLHIPTFCGAPDLQDDDVKHGAIAIDSCGGLLYFWEPATEQWIVSGVGGGGGGGDVCPTCVDTAYAINDSTLRIQRQNLETFDIHFTQIGLNGRRFGIEDSIGVQDRAVDMQDHEFGITGASDTYIESYNSGTGSNASMTTTNASPYSTPFTTQSAYLDANNQNSLLIDHTKIQIQSRIAGNQTLMTFPNPGLPTSTYYIPLTVNGNSADAAGNVTLSVGGSGSVTNVTATAPMSITGTSTIAPNVVADTSKAVGRLATYSDVQGKQAAGNFFTRSGDSASYTWYPNQTLATLPPINGIKEFDSSGRLYVRTSLNKTYSISTSLITTSTSVIDSLPNRSGTFLLNVDTTGKWISDVVKNATADSLYFLSNGAIVKRLSSGGAGGSQTFQQVLTSGRTLASNDSVLMAHKTFNFKGGLLKSDSLLLANNLSISGGARIGDSIVNQTDSVYFFGTSIEAGSGSSSTPNHYINILASRLNTFAIDSSWSGSRFQFVSTGDRSFMAKLPTIPNNRSTIRYILIGSYTVNEVAGAPYGLALSSALDTLIIARGYPARKIILVSGSITGSVVRNQADQRRLIDTTILIGNAKGVQVIDVWTYQQQFSRNIILAADSVHPTDLGHAAFADAISYGINAGIVKTGALTTNMFRSYGNITLDSTLLFNKTSGQNLYGIIDMGSANTTANKILFYNGGSTALRSGIGYNSASGGTGITSRNATPLMFGSNLEANALTTSNAAFYTLGTGAFIPTLLTFNTGSSLALNAGTTNITGSFSWGTGVPTNGVNVYVVNNGSAGTQGGLGYQSSNGYTCLFGRSGITGAVMAAVGVYPGSMTTANCGWYLTSTNQFVAPVSIGVGVASPLAWLHTKSGIAGSPPLKLGVDNVPTRPVLTTAPLKYSVEVDSSATGGNLYYSGSDAIRYTVAKTLTTTSTLDFTSTAAQTSSVLTVTVTGAADGDAVDIGIPNASQNANACFTAWVSATNTVSVKFNNYSSGAIDPASGTFRVAVLKY